MTSVNVTITLEATFTLTLPSQAGDSSPGESDAETANRLLAEIEQQLWGSNPAPPSLPKMKLSVNIGGKTLSAEGGDDAQHVETMECNAAPEYDGLHDGVAVVFSQDATS